MVRSWQTDTDYKGSETKAKNVLLLFSPFVMSYSLWPHGLSTSGSSVLHSLPEFAQIHVYWVGDAIYPSHFLPPSSPFAFNLSQHQGLFQWAGSLHQVAKILELQLHHHNLSNSFVSNRLRGVWSESILSAYLILRYHLCTVKFSHFPGVHTYKCSQTNYSQDIKYFHPSSKSPMVPLWLVPLTPGNYWTDTFPLSKVSYKGNYIVWPKSSSRFISVKCHSIVDNKLNHVNPLLKTL